MSGKTRLSAGYFFNSAVYYLQRYTATETHLRRILQRKIMRAQQRGEEIPAETAQWIDAAVAKCVALGYVNDRLYAESRITSLRREGRSGRYIQRHLQEKGVDGTLAAELLAATGTEDDERQELEAALRTIKRRRLDRLPVTGSDSADRETLMAWQQKNLARLVRAGFSLQLARKALALASARNAHEDR